MLTNVTIVGVLQLRYIQCLIDEVLPSFSTPGERKIITLTSVGFELEAFGLLVQRGSNH